MRTTVLLCDWAEAVAGKLYAQGIGWNVIRAGVPTTFAVGLVVKVEWNETNQRHRLELKLVDPDGHPFPDEKNPVQTGFEFEVGRPAGITPGDVQNVVLAAKVAGMVFPPGRYTWDLYYNGSKLPEGTTFTAIPGGT